MASATRLLLLALIAVLISGCASVRNFDVRNLGIPGVHRATIQQGNVITQEMVDRLRPGMTRRQVRFILGEPILGNTFRADQWDYMYTIQVGARPRSQQRLTLYFDGDNLVSFAGDFLPSGVEAIIDPEMQEAVDAVGEADS